MVGFLTGSLGEFLDRHYDSEKVKTLILANNVYGKHGGPYAPGSALGLLFHLLSGGEHEVQGFYGHVMGGMGAITQAMAAACRERGVEIRTDAAVSRILARGGRAAASRWRTAPSSRPRWSCRTPIPSGRSWAWSSRARCRRSSGRPWPASRWTAPARR